MSPESFEIPRSKASAGRWGRGVVLGVALAGLNIAALILLAHHLVCPEAHAGYVAGERFCRSFAWSALNYAGLAFALALGVLCLRKLRRPERLVLVNIPALLFLCILWGLTEQASDRAAPESAEKVEWRSPAEGRGVWGVSLLAVAALEMAAWRRRG